MENVFRSLLHNTEKEFLPSFDRKIKKSFRVYLTQAEGLIVGLAAKMFTIAGPVLVYGITASILYGLVLNLLQLFR